MLLAISTRPVSAAAINWPEVLPHNNPETAQLVSRTSRTTYVSAVGVDLGLNLLRRHRGQRFGDELPARVRESVNAPGAQSLP